MQCRFARIIGAVRTSIMSMSAAPAAGASAPTTSTDPTVPARVQILPTDDAWLLVAGLLRSCPTAKLVSLQRVQWPRAWEDYCRYRDERLSSVGAINECLLFHGTGVRSADAVLAHPDGLDPRFASQAFYGRGIYLAESANYPIGGRYAHRLPGSDGQRLQLLLVRAALGEQQDFGQRITDQTRAMVMPGVRSEGPPRVLYGSVRAGPHRPFISGTGGSGLDASIIHVVYESRQMYPQYVLEVQMELDPAVASSLATPEIAGRQSLPQQHTGGRRPPPGSSSSAGSSSGAGGIGCAGSGGGAASASSSSAAASAAGGAAVGPPAKRPRAQQVASGSKPSAKLLLTALMDSSQRGWAEARTALERVQAFLDDRSFNDYQALYKAGAFEAVVAVMRAHSGEAELLHQASLVILPLCEGDPSDPPTIARMNAAVDTGALEEVLRAMSAHDEHPNLQAVGCDVVYEICDADEGDASVENRRHQAIALGAMDVVHSAMKTNDADFQILTNGCAALQSLIGGPTIELRQARQGMACSAGVLTTVASATLHFTTHDENNKPQQGGSREMMASGCALLRELCNDNEQCKDAAVRPVDGVMAAIVAVLKLPNDPSLPYRLRATCADLIQSICQGSSGHQRTRALVSAGVLVSSPSQASSSVMRSS